MPPRYLQQNSSISPALLKGDLKKKQGQYTQTPKEVQRCSAKKVFLEISQYSQEKTGPRVSFNKIAGLGLQLY